MFGNLSAARIFIRPGKTDLRKAVNGLAVMIEERMGGKPMSGDLYLFCNHDRRLLKGVFWDKNGFWLCQKRLEKDKFPWPESEEEAVEIKREELMMLLSGIDFWKSFKPLYYQKVS
jgi:transposase